jgi:hypothetical protein
MSAAYQSLANRKCSEEADHDVEDDLLFKEPSNDEEAAMWDFQKTE